MLDKLLEELKEIRITNRRITSQLEEVYKRVVKINQDNAAGIIDNETAEKLLEPEMKEFTRLRVQAKIIKVRNVEIDKLLNELDVLDSEYVTQYEPERIN